jgi:hypothetical protein
MTWYFVKYRDSLTFMFVFNFVQFEHFEGDVQDRLGNGWVCGSRGGGEFILFYYFCTDASWKAIP